MRTLIVCLLLAVVAVAAQTSYRVTLFQPSVVNGTELAPGEYKVQVMDSKVVISKGKQSVEAPAKVEMGNDKYASTSVRYSNGEGKLKIQEIRVGGTKAKIVFN